MADSTILSTPIFLPLEIREKIHSYVLDLHLRSVNPLNPESCFPYRKSDEYSIFHTNRATFIDVGLCYLRTRPFEISIGERTANFRQFLHMFPDMQGYLAVRQLEFRSFQDWTADNLDLSVRCANVRHLTLWFSRNSTVVDVGWESNQFFGLIPYPDAQTIFDVYQLGRLFGLKHVSKIELKWLFKWSMVGRIWEEVAPRSTLLRETEFKERIGEVARLWKEGFEERGEILEVCLSPQVGWEIVWRLGEN
jgi:hypothetical protein